jgi:molybdate transport system ATP-binding protein
VPVLYVTHNVGEALDLAEAVLLLREGTVEAHGPALDLLSRPAMSRAAEAGIENLRRGRIAAHDEEGGTTRVMLDDGQALTIPLSSSRPPGNAVNVAIRAEDVLVAVEPPHGLSARNVVEARIEAIELVGRDALLRCRPASAPEPGRRPWLVRITPSAVDSLGLTSGRVVWLAIKSHSIQVL